METEKEEIPFAPRRDWDAINALLHDGKYAAASRSTASGRFRIYTAIYETVMIARRSIEGRDSTDELRFAEKLALRKKMNAAIAAPEK